MESSWGLGTEASSESVCLVHRRSGVAGRGRRSCRPARTVVLPRRRFGRRLERPSVMTMPPCLVGGLRDAAGRLMDEVAHGGGLGGEQGVAGGELRRLWRVSVAAPPAVGVRVG